MTVAIWYKIPYIIQDHSPFIFSFALEHDVSLRCFIELSTLYQLG